MCGLGLVEALSPPGRCIACGGETVVGLTNVCIYFCSTPKAVGLFLCIVKLIDYNMLCLGLNFHLLTHSLLKMEDIASQNGPMLAYIINGV
ncbi:hypothetical protein FKM82_005787 [Ascaphus truei]